jgi:hypothetical protein
MLGSIIDLARKKKRNSKRDKTSLQLVVTADAVLSGVV